MGRLICIGSGVHGIISDMFGGVKVTVTNDLIMDKMMVELNKARSFSANESAYKMHISKVQVMCELLLAGEGENVQKDKVPENFVSSQQSNVQATPSTIMPTSEAVDTGDMGSIFDF